MKTANLAANIVTQRGGGSQATSAQYVLGNTTIPGGSGSGIHEISRSETSWAGGRKNIKTRGAGIRLGNLKRFLIKSGGNRQGIAGLIGRD